MKTILYAVLVVLISSCSTNNDTLPKNFIGTYVDVENPNKTITIKDVEGNFVEKEGNYSCTGKFIIDNMSEESKTTFYKVTGFELGESNFPDGIHLIGSIDFNSSSSWTAFKEGEWPQFGKSGKTQALHFGEGINGGIGPLYLKK